jgi:cytochrome c oxidase cbb3-type subunit 3
MTPRQRQHQSRAGDSLSQVDSGGTRPALRMLRARLSRLGAGFVLLANLQPQVAHPRPQHVSRPASQGEGIFSSMCASCHGLDGRGSERAPNIAQRPEVQHLSDGALVRIIQDGVPGTGMPAFRSLPAPDVNAVVAYLRVLQGASKSVRLPGNPQRGKELFFSKAKCSECHMVAGSGGFIASDLSSYARTHSLEEARRAITKPAPLFQGRGVVATTRDGQKYIGRVCNEDNFSLQLQTWDGSFHFLSKADLDRVDPDSRFSMPSDYASTLSASELDDLVSYLVSSQETNASEAVREKEE